MREKALADILYFGYVSELEGVQCRWTNISFRTGENGNVGATEALFEVYCTVAIYFQLLTLVPAKAASERGTFKSCGCTASKQFSFTCRHLIPRVPYKTLPITGDGDELTRLVVDMLVPQYLSLRVDLETKNTTSDTANGSADGGTA